ncbi:MAG: cell division topological specificity factor MinE [Tissierellales bacterium]|nr:cell division topological specificity factor MinE [Tissierellales bacterium]
MGILEIFSKRQEKSKDVAKERLKLVLVHDRADLSPRLLELIKNDIIDVISNYAEIDIPDIDIKMTKTTKEGDNRPVSALIANIPIKKIKNRDDL